MQTISVNSGVPHRMQPATAVRHGNYWSERPGVAAKSARTIFTFFPRTRAFRFFSQENFFSAMKNKVHFFLVDFETDF
jgi:hypothetical protein